MRAAPLVWTKGPSVKLTTLLIGSLCLLWILPGCSQTGRRPVPPASYANTLMPTAQSLPPPPTESLSLEDVKKLVKLSSLEIVTGKHAILFRVDPNNKDDEGKLHSPTLQEFDPQDSDLNNLINTDHESVAVLLVGRRQYLLVREALAGDIMAQFRTSAWIQGKPKVLGRLAMTTPPLILISAPGAVLPRSESGYVRAPRLPMAFGKEWIEVTEWNTLMRRYWDMDFERDLELQEAHTRSLPKDFKVNTLKFLLIFPREIRVTSDVWKDEDGTPLTGIASLSDERIERALEIMRRFKRVVEAYTEGTTTVIFEHVILKEPLRFHTKGKTWKYAPCKGESGQFPPPVRDDLAAQLREQGKDKGFDYVFFHHWSAIIDQKRKMGAGPHLAWTGWWTAGARPCTIVGNASLGVVIHEWEHHVFDRYMGAEEGFILAHLHAARQLGYPGNKFRNGYLAYYTDRLRFFRPRDMWLKTDPHVIQDWPREAFTGKEYNWKKIRAASWTQMPELTTSDLRTLTGLKSLEVISPLRQPFIWFKVDKDEAMDSPRATQIKPMDHTLNNLIDLINESAAVVKGPNGHFLFVRPDLVDVYVEMLKISGRGQEDLPVMGFYLGRPMGKVLTKEGRHSPPPAQDNDGRKPLVILKVPSGIPLPSTERAYFAPGK